MRSYGLSSSSSAGWTGRRYPAPVARLVFADLIAPLLAERPEPSRDGILAESLGRVPSGSGDNEPPLFLVHGGAPRAGYARVLGRHLWAELPVHAVPGTPVGGPTHRTIERMATRVADMIEATWPSGPCRVAGYSLGGVLAYETATQLLGRDRTVEFLGLVDTPLAPRSHAAADLTSDLDDVRGALLAALRAGATRTCSGDAPRGAGGVPAERMDRDALVCLGVELSLLPPDLTAEQLEADAAATRAVALAVSRYVTHRLPILVNLFRASVDGAVAPGDVWGSVPAEQPASVVPVSGTHESLIASPDVVALADAMSVAITTAAARRPGPEAPPASLVCVQFGRRETLPVFCVAGAGDSVMRFAELAGAVGTSWRIHGFQARGLDGDTVPHTTVNAAAGAYLRELWETQPRSPVHLLGHSFGGWVAFEMALRLRALGREVASLTIVDSQAPDTEDTEQREFDDVEAFTTLVEVCELAAERGFEIAPREFIPLDLAERLGLLHQRMVRAGLMSPRTNAAVMRGPYRAFAACLRASYRPRETYEGPMHLLLANDSRRDEQENQREQRTIVAGWRRWVPALAFARLAGNHVTALKAPHVDTLARHLCQRWQASADDMRTEQVST
ncbi:MAG: alpha/beta fold hydrolase [Gemmatimonadaceae bacterium]